MRRLKTQFLRPICFMLAALPLALFTGCAGEVRQTSGSPRLELIDSIQDLDTIGQNEIVEVSFRVRNTGEGPLRLTIYKPDCECLNVRTPELIVAPGKQSRLRVTFSGRGFHGNIVKMLRFEANDSLNSVKDIYLYANVRSPFQFEQ